MLTGDLWGKCGGTLGFRETDGGDINGLEFKGVRDFLWSELRIVEVVENWWGFLTNSEGGRQGGWERWVDTAGLVSGRTGDGEGAFRF